MPRLSRLFAAGLFALTFGCDDEPSPADAGRDGPRADAATSCRPADCQSQAKPPAPCPPGTVADYTCARSFNGQCTWMQPRCTPGADGGTPGDAPGTETSPADAPTD